MILELDLGNSRIKWRLLRSESVIADQGAAPDLSGLKDDIGANRSIRCARICSVRKGEALKELVEWIEDRFGVALLIAKVTTSCGKVTNRYQDPARLGIDRWLAMLAAYERVQGPCIIIDGGTALTVDILDSEGLHQGGFILPGLSLMARSLEENTAIKLSKQGQVPSIDLGHSTDQAVRNGILAAVIALIEKLQLDRLQATDGAVKIVLTGGDAGTLSAMLEHAGLHTGKFAGAGNPFEVVKDLVLDGLGLACQMDDLES